MRIEWLGAIVLPLLLFGPSPPLADEVEIRGFVEAYFRDFNAVRTPEYLAESYLHSPLTVVSGAGVLHLESTEEVEGWLRSELVEARVCMTAENIAVVGLRLARVGRDERTLLSGAYTLFRAERWRIATLLIADSESVLNCDASNRREQEARESRGTGRATRSVSTQPKSG